MRDYIQLLTRLVTAQAWRQEVGIGHVDRSVSTRVRDFINLDPPIFTRADPNEDPQVFIDRMQRTLRVMKVTATESVELAFYRLQDVAVNWYESWELSRGEDAPLAVWHEFTEAFIHHYLSPELKRARVDRYAPTIVSKMEDPVHRFVMGLEPHFLNDCMSVTLQPGMDISRIQAYAQGVEERKQKQRADREHDRVQSKRARSSVPSGHVMRDCLTRGGTSLVQPAGSVVASSLSVRYPRQGSQAPIGSGRGRGGTSSSSSPQNCIYALASRQDQESSPDVVTSILSVSSHDVYALIDPGSTLSYVTPLVASKFGIKPELVRPLVASTPVGDPVIAKRVYKDCIVVVHSQYAVADLIELDMVKFDVIMGMDWLASCYANVDYRSKMVQFQFPGEPVLEWKGNTASPREFPGIEGKINFSTDSNAPRGDQWKAKVVADALSCRSMSSMSCLQPEKSGIAHDIHQLTNLGVRLLDSGDTGITIQDAATSYLVIEVKERQYEDLVLAHYRDTIPQKEKIPFEITEDGVLRDPSRVVSVDDVQVTEQLSYEETPIVILDRQVRRLRTKDVASVKVLWRNKYVEEMTWEAEEDMKSRYPHLFPFP
ncbi:uncharacterized protein [Nicotiana tomentosiformis]|uniref:uncharacterized protein n=1 Tax=Nicotiana tomentosiformis TaxID=4098 RepID=UPI00388C4371